MMTDEDDQQDANAHHWQGQEHIREPTMRANGNLGAIKETSEDNSARSNEAPDDQMKPRPSSASARPTTQRSSSPSVSNHDSPEKPVSGRHIALKPSGAANNNMRELARFFDRFEFDFSRNRERRRQRFLERLVGSSKSNQLLKLQEKANADSEQPFFAYSQEEGISPKQVVDDLNKIYEVTQETKALIDAVKENDREVVDASEVERYDSASVRGVSAVNDTTDDFVANKKAAEKDLSAIKAQEAKRRQKKVNKVNRNS